MKFSTTEIKLCQDIAKKHRKKIKYGDWLLINFPRLGETVTLFDTKWEECPNRFLNTSSLYNYSTDEYYKEYIPLWALEDCLEFLREKKLIIHLLTGKPCLCVPYKINTPSALCRGRAKTPLEACLKAILAVLEEEGNEAIYR